VIFKIAKSSPKVLNVCAKTSMLADFPVNLPLEREDPRAQDLGLKFGVCSPASFSQGI
jgi:hypothetical protein